MTRRRQQPGFTLVEVLISLAILAILVATFLPILGWLVSRTRATAFDAQASLVLQEAIEVGYNVMVGSWDRDWSRYPPGVYHPAVDVGVSPAIWVLVPGSETGVEARFGRQMSIMPVCRDQSTGEKLEGDCPDDSRTRDDDSKLLSATVDWIENGRSKSIKAQLLVTYLGD